MHALQSGLELTVSVGGVVRAGTWDLSKEGLVFGLAVGPYGTLLALCWDRGTQMAGASKLVLLHSDPSEPLLSQPTHQKLLAG